MHRPLHRWVLVILIAVLVIYPLTSAPTLDEIVSKALAASSRMRDLELTKQDTLIRISLNQVEDEIGVSVSGDLSSTIHFDSSSATIQSKEGVEGTIILPNDGKTAITLSTGSMSYGTAKNTYSIAPNIGASHTFTYGLTDDNRKNLANRSTELSATSAYESSRLSFASTLYTQIASILDNEKSIKTTEKDLADLKRTLEQDLSLKRIREDSLAYKAQERAIQTQETTLEGLKAARTLYLKQFALLAGFEWEGVEGIREPNLSLAQGGALNSALRLKQLELELAKEDLALERATHSNKDLTVGGSLGVSTSRGASSALDPTIVTKTQISGGATARLKTTQYSASGGVSGTYNIQSNTFTPTLSISGSWTNNPRSASENLTLQRMENAVLSAELAYQSALDEYEQNLMALQNSVAAWQMRHDLLKVGFEYNLETLQLQKTLFERGLATKTQVDDAQFAVEIDEYTLKASLLEGLKYEIQIKSLQI
jgi:hypothetical protein